MKKTFIITLLIIVFVATLVILQWTHSMNADEGVVLSGAWNLYNGKIIYKDFFEFISPAPFYLVYLIFFLFGPNYYAALFISMLFQIASVYCVYLIFLKNSKSYGWSILCAYGWLILSSISYPLINHNTYSAFVSIAFLLIFIKFLKNKNPTFLILSGILTGVIFYFLQTKGAAIFLVTLIFLIYLSWKKTTLARNAVLYCASSIITLALGLILFGAKVITNLFITSPGYLKIAYMSIDHKTLIIFTIACAIFFLLYIRKKNINDVYIFLFLMQFGLIASTLNAPNKYHIGINSFPMVILIFIFLKTNSAWMKNLSIKIYLSAIFTIAAAAFLYTSAVTLYNKKIYIENMIAEMKKIIGSEKIYSYPFLPNVYFELQKPNPYYNDFLIENHFPQEYFEKNLQILKQEKPKYLIIDYDLVKKYQPSYDNIIDRHIKKNYEKTTSFYDVEIWEIKEK